MRCQENSNLESYLDFSRKNLQLLCKNNNLPANRSTDQLTKSLALFFENKNAQSSPSKEKLITSAAGIKSKEADYPSEDNSKELLGTCGRKILLGSGNRFPPCIEEKECDRNWHSDAREQMTISTDVDLQSSKSASKSAADIVHLDNPSPKSFGCFTSKSGDKGREPFVIANIHQNEKDTQTSSEWHVSGTKNEVKKYAELRNNSKQAPFHATFNRETCNLYSNKLPRLAKCSAKGGFLSPKETSTQETPSFQFFVMSEEGLDLHVDLNSSPAEWINSLKDGVRTSLEIQDHKITFPPSHTGSLSAADAHTKKNIYSNVGEKNSDYTTSTLSTDSDNCQSEACHTDATFASSDSSVLTSSTIPVKMPGSLESNHVVSSCAPLLTSQKSMLFDASTFPADGNAPEESVGASSGAEKSNTSVLDSSLRPTGEVDVLSPEGTSNQEQMESPSFANYIPQSDDLVNSLTGVPEAEENNILQFNGVDNDIGAYQVSIEREVMGNLEEEDACQVAVENGLLVGSSETADCHDEPSNAHELVGLQMPDCSPCEPESDTVSAGSILKTEKSIANDPDSKFMDEQGISTVEKEEDTSECTPSQNSHENRSKRALGGAELHEEFQSKRHRTSEKNKNEMKVNLRITRTSLKETMSKRAACPRRSTRLCEVENRKLQRNLSFCSLAQE